MTTVSRSSTMSHPTATRRFDWVKERGLVDVLVGEASLEEVLKFNEKGGYWFLCAGNKTQNPTDQPLT